MNLFFKKNNNRKIVILDIPLFLENKLNKKKNILIFVSAKKKEIQKRLRKRANYNSKILNRLRKFQLSLEFKKKKSHYIIKNDFKPLTIKKSVKILKEKIFKNETNSFRY